MNIDVQAQEDFREIAIQKVGIRNLKIPMRLQSGQFTTAKASMYCSLSESVKGTNMSRFSECLISRTLAMAVDKQFMINTIKDLKKRMESEDAYIKLAFTYFITKKAPVSKVESISHYDVILETRIDKQDNIDMFLFVETNYTSLCPCSKEMSDQGAHNQRSTGSIKIKLPIDDNRRLMEWIENLGRIIETEGSCEIWNTLKRPDEKYVTDRMYDNPKFVEDYIRDVALKVKILDVPFVAVANNYESIHQSDAVAIYKGGLQ